MAKKLTDWPVQFSPFAMLLLVIALFVLPLRHLLAWCIAVFVHELCHCIAIRLCLCRILQIKIGVMGAQLQTEPLSPGKELLCAASGPVGSLLLMAFIHVFPLLAICGLLQGAYNLLPMYPMDGGRILHGALCTALPDSTVEKVLRTVRIVFCWGLTGMAIFVYWRWSVGVHPLIVAALLLLRKKNPLQRKSFVVQ